MEEKSLGQVARPKRIKVKYADLIDQAHEFPNEDFTMDENNLEFCGIPLMPIIKQYGTPLKITYLPKISSQIEKARRWFNVAIAKADYQGEYNYCYCTKSSHFSFVLEEVLKNKVHLETSSAFDIDIIDRLYEEKYIDNKKFIVCNGFKMPQYLKNIARLINDGFVNTLPVLDNLRELDDLESEIKVPAFNVGIRIASEEEPKFEFYTSRLGIGYKDIMPFFERKIKDNPRVSLKMLHFFINTGINDNAYYWNELIKAVDMYCRLKKVCPELKYLNIGGGWPIKNSLDFNYDFEYMAEEIILQIKTICNRNGVPEPDIFTEFGSFTVGESGATFFRIIDQKRQNDRENWNMIDGSFMTSLPDSWALNKRFLMLPINNWNFEYERVFLGGLTCDSDDYYNSEAHRNAIYIPRFQKGSDQYIGFFYTGAYQEAISGFGGIQHCLIPAPKHVIVDKDENGEVSTRLFSKEQSYKSMLKILGY